MYIRICGEYLLFVEISMPQSAGRENWNIMLHPEKVPCKKSPPKVPFKNFPDKPCLLLSLIVPLLL